MSTKQIIKQKKDITTIIEHAKSLQLPVFSTDEVSTFLKMPSMDTQKCLLFLSNLSKDAASKNHVIDLNDYSNKIKQNMKKLHSLGMDYKTFIDMVITKPSILNSNPQTLYNNTNTIKQKLKEYDIKDNEIIKALKRQPSLLTRKPQTIFENINKTINEYKGCKSFNPQRLIKAAIRQPSLFTLSHETLKNNIQTVANNFANNGLDMNTYIDSALKYPYLFYASPQTITSKITDVVDAMHSKGLTTEQYLRICTKQPSILGSKAKTIIEHFQIIHQIHQEAPKKPVGKTVFDIIEDRPMSLGFSSQTLLKLQQKNKAEKNTQDKMLTTILKDAKSAHLS